MTPRPAQGAELARIEEIVQRAYEDYIARIGRPPGPMGDDYGRRVADGVVWVAVDADKVVGLIVLIEEAEHLLVENVAVDPERQGEGIGRGLLGFAEERAREVGLPALRLYTNAAMTENLALYARLGYEEVDRRTDNGFERVFFVKRLPA